MVLLWLAGLAVGCGEASRARRPVRQRPLATSRSISFLTPSPDRERLYFLTDVDAKKERATLDVVDADGAFKPLAALVVQPAAVPEADTALRPWWDERPLHPPEGAPAFQLSADGTRALAVLHRYGRHASMLAALDARSRSEERR